MDPNSNTQNQGQVPLSPQPAAPDAAQLRAGEQIAPNTPPYMMPQQAQVPMPQMPAPPANFQFAAPPPTSPAPIQQAPATPHLKANPNSTQNALQIAEIRDGIVIMNDGSFRSVVMVKSINFDLMSNEEQEAVEFSFQGFLNSLYFPIQIFIRSQRVDLRPYIERLDKIRSEHENMLLALLMDDYLNYITALADQTNIMDKRFYVVIPYIPTIDVQKALTQSKDFFSGLKDLFNSKEQHVTIHEADLAKAKDELRNRVQAVLGGLQQCGIAGLPLDTQELIELYYDSYNPDTATRQQLKNFNDLSTPVVTKGQGIAPQPNLERELL